MEELKGIAVTSGSQAQASTSVNNVTPLSNRYTATDYRRFIAEQEKRADEAPTANQRTIAELRAEAYRRQLADEVYLLQVAADEAASDEVAL